MRDSQFQVVVTRRDDVTRLGVSGELDLAGAPGFYELVCRHGREATHGVELDLAQLRFVDSSGMQAIVNAREALERAGRTLCIVQASTAVHRVFDLAGLGELFPPGDSAVA